MLRVTSLSGLHLFNMDPHSIKALDSTVLKYAYLREKYRPALPRLQHCKNKPKHIPDRQWYVTKSTMLVQQHSNNLTGQLSTTLPKKGL